jgi:hypothetical protein
MNFREWLLIEAMVSNIIDAGPDGVYLNLDGKKFGPVADLKQQGNQWVAYRMGNPAGAIVDIDPRIAQRLVAKYNQIKQRQQQRPKNGGADWKTMGDLEAKWGKKKQTEPGITVYRGIAGPYDPNWSSSTEQHWSPERNVAWSVAVEKGSRDHPPTLLRVFVPEQLIDFKQYDYRMKPQDRVSIHGANIIDIPNAILKQLKVEVVPQEETDRWFGTPNAPRFRPQINK